MRSFMMILSAALVCLSAVRVSAQSPVIEYGETGELQGVTRVYIDTQNDTASGMAIVTEIRKRLPKLQIVTKPEDSDLHLRFYYEAGPVAARPNYPPAAPPVYPDTIPIAAIVKILSPDRIRVLMSYRGYPPTSRMKLGWVTRTTPEREFGREFVKSYLAVNRKTSGANKLVTFLR